MRTQIGLLISTTRKKRGLTQIELAERSKINSAQYVSNIERGLSPLPSFHVKRVAKVLELPSSKVIGAIIKDYETYLLKETR
jgi:transcriptional regulator with XRE-family HTH domain